jgi:putative membrane protein
MPKIFQKFLIRFIISGAALYVAALLISGIHLNGWKAILLVAIIFGLVNAFIKPLVKFVTCLIRTITLGLFTLVINIGMLYLTEWLAHGLNLSFDIDNILSALLGAITISVVSFILSKMLK